MRLACHPLKAGSRRWDWDTLSRALDPGLPSEGLSCHSRSKEDVIPEGWLLRRAAHVQ